MTKYYFRLTYINARRLLRVDGLDTVATNERPPGGLGRKLIRGQTEACRAIHGYYHEPQTTRHADHSFRLLHQYIVFRQVDHRAQRHCTERLDGRRRDPRVSCGYAGSKPARSWQNHAGDRASSRPSKSADVAFGNLGF